MVDVPCTERVDKGGDVVVDIDLRPFYTHCATRHGINMVIHAATPFFLVFVTISHRRTLLACIINLRKAGGN